MKSTAFIHVLAALMLSVTAAAVRADAAANNGVDSLLPDSSMVRKVLLELPEMRATQFQQTIADAQKQKLQSGGYEWQLRVSQTERRETGAANTHDQELLIERPVRWFGKAEHDLRIGEMGLEVARLAYADRWHESARMLLNDWFDSLRSQAGVIQFRQQVQLSEQLREIARKRVAAGDAARLDLLLTETEVDKLKVQLQMAEIQHSRQMELLQSMYPGLKLPAIQNLPVPGEATGKHRIEAILEDNHELELAELEAEYSKAQFLRASKEQMPDPVIGIRAARERSGQDRLFGISIAIPLGGQSRRADTRQAEGKAGMAQAKLDAVRQKVWRDAQRVTQQRNQTYAIWQVQDQVRRQVEQQTQVMFKAYQLGEVALSESLQIRKLALETAFSAQQMQLDALLAEARFELDAHRLWPFDDHH